MIKELKFFSQLDVLRCIAVLLTMVAHWFPAVGWRLIPYTWNGVDIFFTISGFLITLILFRKKELFDVGRLEIIRNFMMRRALRLFPIYYLFIFFFYITYKSFHLLWWLPELAPYLLTYTTNIYFYSLNNPGNGIFQHTWSLAVEEQFYLIWPWLVVFISPKRFKSVIIGLILFAFVVHAFPAFFHFLFFPPVKLFNTLCVGALLAYLSYYESQTSFYKFIYKYKSHFLFLFVALYMMVIIFFPTGKYFELVREVMITPACFFIVFTTVVGWKGAAGNFMTCRPLAYFGKISYGVYLFHMPIPKMYSIVMAKYAPQVHFPPVVLLAIFFSITLVLASVSYRYLEIPFLKWKQFFN